MATHSEWAIGLIPLRRGTMPLLFCFKALSTIAKWYSMKKKKKKGTFFSTIDFKILHIFGN